MLMDCRPRSSHPPHYHRRCTNINTTITMARLLVHHHPHFGRANDHVILQKRKQPRSRETSAVATSSSAQAPQSVSILGCQFSSLWGKATVCISPSQKHYHRDCMTRRTSFVLFSSPMYRSVLLFRLANVTTTVSSGNLRFKKV